VGDAGRADVVVLETVAGHVWLAARHSINVAVWLQTATADVVARIDRAFEARFNAIQQRMSTTHVIAQGVGPPDPDGRAALIKMNDRLAHTVGCGAIIIERGGLSGIAVRSAITGMMIVAPKQYRVEVFDGLEACAPWVAEQHARATSEVVPEDEILEFLRYSRRTAI
jgi:hypothetical protein